MNAPAALLAIRLLTADTFRQARASGVVWLWLAVTAVCVALCLSVGVAGDDTGPASGEMLSVSERDEAAAAFAAAVGTGAGQSVGVWSLPMPLFSPAYKQVSAAVRTGVPIAGGRLTLGFGAVPVGLSRDRRQAVREVQGYLSGAVLDSAGLLLVLLWTAGFLPSFLKPHSVLVMLAKPVPRWSLLMGKYVGAVAFAAAQAAVFVAATWLALALRTGVWDATWFLCVPLFVLHFAVFYAFSALLAVATRNAIASAYGAVLFWLACWGMNFARHSARLVPDIAGAGSLVEAGYWLLPKPLDFHLLLGQALGIGSAVNLDLDRLAASGAWSPEASLLTSALAGAALILLAMYEFAHAEY